MGQIGPSVPISGFQPIYNFIAYKEIQLGFSKKKYKYHSFLKKKTNTIGYTHYAPTLVHSWKDKTKRKKKVLITKKRERKTISDLRTDIELKGTELDTLLPRHVHPAGVGVTEN